MKPAVFSHFFIPALAFAALFPLSGCRQSTPAAPQAAATTTPSLSQMALLGRDIFFDTSLSASGRQACSSCHDPQHAYGPPDGLAVQPGGKDLKTFGFRAVPSLEYVLNRTPIWTKEHPASRTEQLTERENAPVGGFDWDGRFNSLHDQAAFPLLERSEMANANAADIAHKLQRSGYSQAFEKACGAGIFDKPDAAFDCMRRALERFLLEDPSFHPFTSKYDAYLDHKATLSAQEEHGLKLFNDPDGGNCAGCHLSSPGADGSHPLFTDYQFEAIGVPRNMEIAANHGNSFYDLGLCGPLRDDHRDVKTFCGMFKTPTLRNTALRGVYFHNGRFHSLRDALRWYVERDSNPAAWYPNGESYNDLPPELRSNVDHINVPFAPREDKKPVWSSQDIDDVIAFLNTLNDGYVTSK
ncbi:cytochrome-c peroxidase [Silvibacterium acidisoli]|uniref:cytochrome-c peroxidase n=1 Tax=Acidobacteriaceae bacterium ZG23-2 TaxID=2883246 RepID=UPI00406CEC66